MSYIDMLQQLISMDTSVPTGRDYGEAINFLKHLLDGAGFESTIVEIPCEVAGRSGRLNLVSRRRAEGRRRLIMYSHVDVVSGEGWDAFTPRVTQDRIYGRGAADMKGGIAALLHALDRVKDQALGYDTLVIVTTDEETGQASQLRFLGPYLQPSAGAAVFSLDASFGYVTVANLGVVQLEIEVQGTSVHSGLAHMGENAVEKALALIAPLLTLKESLSTRKSDVRVHPGLKLDRMETRLNVNRMSGGTGTNIVPDTCAISVDRRLIPEEDTEAARQELMTALGSVRGVRWRVTKEHQIPPTHPTTQDPAVIKLAHCLEEVIGQTGRYGDMISGDLPHIAVSEWKAHPFGLGVIRPECNVHGKDEFAYKKDIEALSHVISRFLTIV